jgi:hypothetical protein
VSGYTIAWLVVFIMTGLGSIVLFRLISNIGNNLVRVLIVALTATVLFVPAPVPGYDDQLAPAFIVYLFEAMFQLDGNPQTSLRILLFSLSLVAVLVVLGFWVYRRLSRGPGSQSDAD